MTSTSPVSADFAAALLDEELLPPGQFTLVERLGEGGMGSVWRASGHDSSVPAEVAIKLIKPGLDGQAVVAQFEAEHAALALMDHPAIARMHGAGRTNHGRPYFVMELVRGESITRYCDTAQATIEQRLTLMARVCDAVAHAHTKGVLHRDIKPGNVLVSPGNPPAVKVIDFGLAKAFGARLLTEHTIATWLTRAVGTPEYMSPEQVAGAPFGLDTRSDIYSLGVLLYELLVGLLPIDIARGADITAETAISRVALAPVIPAADRFLKTDSETRLRLARQRSTSPSELERVLSGDLRWVLDRCLRRDREERYASASDLRRDLDNWLAGRPLLAGPDSPRYRVQKFLKRNRPLVAGVVSATLALVAGLGLTTWQLVRANAARAAADAEAQRARAAIAAVNTLVTEQIPETRQGTKFDPVKFLMELDDTLAPTFEQWPDDQIRMRTEIIRGLSLLGGFDQAVPLARKNLDESERRYSQNSEQTLSATLTLAMCLWRSGQPKQAFDLVAPHESQLNDVFRRRENGRIAEMYLTMWPPLLHETGDPARALSVAQWMLEQHGAARRDDPMVTVLNNLLGALLIRQERLVDALPYAQAAYEARLAQHGPKHPLTLRSQANYAVCLLKVEPTQAIEVLKEALKWTIEVHGADSDETGIIHRNIAQGMQEHAGAPHTDALQHAERAVAIFSARYPEDHPRRKEATALRDRLRAGTATPEGP